MLSVDANHVTDWLPAFVLDTLTEEEARQVSEHLQACTSCQAELARLQPVLDDLPLAVTQTTPPPQLKRKIMQSIHSRQPAHPVDPIRETDRSFIERLGDFSRRYLPAFGLALIILLVLSNLLLWRQLNLIIQETTTPFRVVALSSSPFSPGAMGTLIMKPDAQYFTLVVADLTALTPDQQYQVWLIKGPQHTSAGVFSINPSGYASLQFLAPQPLQQYDAIGISVEPAGGSPLPTGTSVFNAQLLK